MNRLAFRVRRHVRQFNLNLKSGPEGPVSWLAASVARIGLTRSSSTALLRASLNQSSTTSFLRRRPSWIAAETLSTMPEQVSQPTRMNEALALLKRRFQFDAFRSGQKEVIELILGESSRTPIPSDETGRALAVFPTGSGKSLCYQLPALLFDEGITLVVSPLMALMKDQVDSLLRQDIPAACLDSSLTAAETREVYNRIASREISILFVSPERFNNTRFTHAIKKVPIALFAVDEAHCISEWGHSFRPDYLRLARWANRLDVRRRLALTATATPKVAADICKRLEIPFPAAQVRMPSVRPNLTTRVTLVSSVDAKSADDRIKPRVEILAARLRERDPGPTIVYVTLQSTATNVAEMLRKRGFTQAMSYHAGMRQDDRKQTQDSFMENKHDALVVATIAFGMGMDHSSIRYVYHLNVPKTLESYIQEIGRAGRDGLPSICESLVCVDDIPTLEGFIYGEAPSKTSVHSAVQDLFKDAKVGEDVEYSSYDMCFKHDIRETSFGQLIAQLDLTFNAVEETTPFFSTIECTMLPVKDRKLPPEGSIGRQVLDAGVKKISLIHIDVRKVSEDLELEYGKISRICDDLVNDGYLLKSSSKKLMQRVKVKHIPDDLKEVADKLYGLAINSRDRQELRLQQVVNFYSTEECQTKYLANHLGDTLNFSGPCGHCEVCVGDGQKETLATAVKHRTARSLDERRWALIQVEDLPRDNPMLIARFASGISSPIISRKYRKLRTFGSMSDHDFNVLLEAAKKYSEKSS